MPRFLWILLIFTVLAVVAFIFIFPKIKERIVGEQFLTKVEILKADLLDVPVKGGAPNEKQLNLVLSIRLTFPIGQKPQSLEELQLVDRNGKSVEIDWELERPWEDDYNRSVAQVELRDVYLAPTFRKGTLKRGPTELCPFEVPEPPFQAAEKSNAPEGKTP